MEKNPQKEKKVKVLDFNAIVMIICLAFIFSFTILNKLGILESWISISLMILFFAIMAFFLIKSIKKNKEMKDELSK